MDGVENSIYSGPVIVGIGTKEQEGALLTAGADKVFDWRDMKDMLLATAGSSIRAQDTLLMVQPSVIRAADLRHIQSQCGGDLMFQVVGHEPTRDLEAFRKQKPKASTGVVQPLTGRPSKIKYTTDQANAIIRAWHAVPKKTRVEVARDADRILGLSDGTVKPTWVRDLVRKYVGTAQREQPADWAGIATGSKKED